MKGILILCSVFVAIVYGDYVPIADLNTTLSGRIVSGDLALINQFPWHAALTALPTNRFCGGSLITEFFVLTSAHCLVGATTVTVRLGTNHLSTGTVFTAGIIIRHQAFNPNNHNNDVALIQLPTSAVLSPAIQTIQLARRLHADMPLDNREGWISGFGGIVDGAPNQIQKLFATVTTITNAACSDIYGPSNVLASTICTRGLNPSRQNAGACGGDEGGALVIPEGAINFQIGIISFTSGRGCHVGDPTGYARVSHYLDWIQLNTGITITP